MITVTALTPGEQREARYRELHALLEQANAAARNGHWMTCGTWAKSVTALAYEYGGQDAAEVGRVAGAADAKQLIELYGGTSKQP